MLLTWISGFSAKYLEAKFCGSKNKKKQGQVSLENCFCKANIRRATAF